MNFIRQSNNCCQPLVPCWMITMHIYIIVLDISDTQVKFQHNMFKFECVTWIRHLRYAVKIDLTQLSYMHHWRELSSGNTERRIAG